MAMKRADIKRRGQQRLMNTVGDAGFRHFVTLLPGVAHGDWVKAISNAGI